MGGNLEEASGNFLRNRITLCLVGSVQVSKHTNLHIVLHGNKALKNQSHKFLDSPPMEGGYVGGCDC